jgi:hypothetical protein
VGNAFALDNECSDASVCTKQQLMLPSIPATAVPAPHSSNGLRAQHEASLASFLHEGNLWLMNGDGADQRSLTDDAEPVQDSSWSPSGRYPFLVQRGGRHAMGRSS